MQSTLIAAPPSGAERKHALLAAGAVTLAFAWCYAGVFRALVDQWWSNSMYSYAFLIPVISIYLVWTSRTQIAAAISAPSYRTGIPALAIGLLLLLAGRAGAVLAVQEISILPTLVGIVLLAGGTSLLRALAFPLGYLLFMIPVWDVLTSRMHAPFQMLSASIGEALMRLVNVPVYRTATTIELPNITLEVAESCSGVNYLIAIAAVAFPYAHLSVAGQARRIAVIAFAVIIAILSNGLRVAVIGVAVFSGLSGDIHGPGHLMHGMVVAVIGYIALFVGAHFAGRGSTQEPQPAVTPVESSVTRRVAMRPLAYASVALIAVALWPMHVGAAPMLTARNLSVVAAEQRGWIAAPDAVNGEPVMRVPGADTELMRTFRSVASGSAQLYVGYYARQAQGRELIGYTAGHAPGAVTPVTLQLLSGRSQRVASVTLQEGARQRYVLYWYDLNGRITAEPLAAKALTVWDSLVRGRSNGALVVVTLDPPAGAAIEPSRAAVQAFAAAVLPDVQEYLASDR